MELCDSLARTHRRQRYRTWSTRWPSNIHFFTQPYSTDSIISDLFVLQVDKDGTGMIDFPEFLSMMSLKVAKLALI